MFVVDFQVLRMVVLVHERVQLAAKCCERSALVYDCIYIKMSVVFFSHFTTLEQYIGLYCLDNVDAFFEYICKGTCFINVLIHLEPFFFF